MTYMEGLMIFLAVLAGYFIVVAILHKTGFLEKHNLSLFGPALMWRTDKGKKFIDWIARRDKFWNIYANTGIVICFIVMILMLFLLITILPLTFITGETVVSSNPQLAIGIPGLNPLIPLWYGILGLLIALLVHEFSHGILVRAGKLKVKSLGLLLFIVPIGAFCEPDEEELKKTSIKKRMRVFAAGPTSNIVTAFICLGLISFMVISFVQPAANGVGVYSVIDDLPADEIGLEPGMIITSINGVDVTNITSFKEEVNATSANQTVEISYVLGEQNFEKNVKLADKYQIFSQASIDKFGFVNETLVGPLKGKGYLGVSVMTQYKKDLSLLKNPFQNFPFGFLEYIGIPILGFMDGYSSMNQPFSNYYIINGFLPDDVFWIIINSLYWIFWINFMVATFNVLPMIPLDGGYLFKDLIDAFLRKIKKNLVQEKREKIALKITTIVSLFILFIILAPIIVPNIMKFI